MIVQDFQSKYQKVQIPKSKYQKVHDLISELSMKDLKHESSLVDSPLTSANNHISERQEICSRTFENPSEFHPKYSLISYLNVWLH